MMDVCKTMLGSLNWDWIIYLKIINILPLYTNYLGLANNENVKKNKPVKC